MAVSAGYLPLILTFVVCFSTNCIPVHSATTKTDKLVNQICKNTTDFNFCRAVIYSSPLAQNADEFTLAYIVFRQAYTNGSDATNYIASWIKSKKGGHDKEGSLAGMEKCQRFYKWAVHSLGEALDNIYSDTYYGLDRSAIDAEGYVRDCEASFKGPSSPMSAKNQNMIKLSNVCLAVSQLFPYA